MLIHMKHGMARLDNVWGVGGGQRPVMFLISKVHICKGHTWDTHEENKKEKSSPITLQSPCVVVFWGSMNRQGLASSNYFENNSIKITILTTWHNMLFFQLSTV